MMICLDAQQNAVQQQEIGSWTGWQQEARKEEEKTGAWPWAIIAMIFLLMLLGSGSGGDEK